MQLSELHLNRYLYRDSNQSSETQDAAFVSADSSDAIPASIPSGGAAQDINTGNVKIDGAQLEEGTYPVTILDVSNWGWGQTCSFSSTDSDTVSWTAGTFTSADGTAYSISSGNTGNMTSKTYIYLDLNVSETAYQITTTSSESVGVGKVLIAVAEDGTTDATYMLSEATQIVGDNILANTIDASKIVTGQLIVGTNVGLGTAFATADAGNLATLDLVETAQLGTTVIVGGYIKTSLLTADNIITGALQSTGYSEASTVFSNTGMKIDLDTGEIRTPNLAIDSSGNAYLRGFIRASSGEIGGWNINSKSIYKGPEDYSGYTANVGDVTIHADATGGSIHANKFYLDKTGAIFANSVTLEGSITATSGSINGDLVTEGIIADNITTGILSVGGTDQPTEINLFPSTHTGSAGTMAAKLNWKDAEDTTLGKIWTDDLGYMGFNVPTGAGIGSGAWISGGNLNTARKGLAGAGTQEAALSFGGDADYGNGLYLKTTEEYNGSSWSSSMDLIRSAGYLAGCGSQTAGLKFGGSWQVGGYTIKNTEEYNGTSWSVGGDLNTAVEKLAGCGTQTAGLSFGGYAYVATTEEYNGTSWSVGGNLNTGRQYLAGAGTQTAGLSFGGYGGLTSSKTTETYDGTSWTIVNPLSSETFALAGCGTQGAALCFGGLGSGSVFNKTEKWDGTSWSAGADLNTGRLNLAGAGTQTAGLSFGGKLSNNTLSSITEEYNDSTVGGRFYFYTSNIQNVIIQAGAQTIFDYGISCRGNFNVGVPNLTKKKARFTDGAYFDSTDSIKQEIWGGNESLIYNAKAYHYFNLDEEEKFKISSTGVSVNNGFLYLPILTTAEAASYAAQDGACYYNSTDDELKMYGNGGWKTIHIF